MHHVTATDRTLLGVSDANTALAEVVLRPVPDAPGEGTPEAATARVPSDATGGQVGPGGRPFCECRCGVELSGNQRRWASKACKGRDARAAAAEAVAATVEASTVSHVDVVDRAIVPWDDWWRGLVVPLGHPNAGQALDIGWCADALAPDAPRAALVSCARKNGKTSAVAARILHGCCNGENPAWRAGVASLRTENAAETLDLVRGLLPQVAEPSVRVYKDRVIGPRGIARISSTHAGAGHSAGFDWAVMDEMGLMPARMLALLGAMRTALSARDGAMLGVGVQGDSPVMREMLADPETLVTMHAAPLGCRLDDEGAWYAANPSLGFAKSIDYMRREAARAARSREAERQFRTLDLNLAGSTDAVGAELLDALEWRACLAHELPPAEGPCTVGVDLGGSWSLTCIAGYWPRTGRLELRYAFPDTPALEDRGLQDGDPDRYTDAVSAGRAIVTPGRVADVGALIGWAMGDWGEVVGLGADRYRRSEALTKLATLPNCPPFYPRGTGAGKTADGSHDVRSFGDAARGGRLAALADDRILTCAVRDTRLRFDPAGNPAIDKSGWTARIDAVAAAVIAIGLAALLAPEPAADDDDW